MTLVPPGARASRLALLVVLAVLVARGSAHADARDLYNSGLEAAGAGNWREAERLLRAAIAEDGDEKPSRAFRRSYFPHFHLGRTLAQLGDCEGALKSWAESTRQAQIHKSKDGELAQLLAGQESCGRQLETAAAARERARTAVDRARSLEADVLGLAESPVLRDLWSAGDPSFALRHEHASRLIEAARQVLGRDASAIDFENAASEADRAANELEVLLADARARRQEVSQQTATALEQLEGLEKEARGALGTVEDLDPYPPRLAQLVAEVRQVLDRLVEAKSAVPVPGPDGIAELREALDAAGGRLRRAARRPPAALQDVVRLFIDGEHQQVAEALVEGSELAASSDPKIAAQVCLLRSASRFTLWVAGGEQDDALLASVIDDVAACKALGSPAPPERFFSPRFLAFYAAPPPRPEVAASNGTDHAG